MRMLLPVLALTLLAGAAWPERAPVTPATPRQAAGGVEKNSYALVVGMNDYQFPWLRLGKAGEDAKEVRRALENLGFAVECEMNLDAARLIERLRKFVNEHGLRPDNRLLVYYVGHGYLLAGDDGRPPVGYLVPVGAPDPGRDRAAFLRAAVSMEQVRALAEEMRARQVLFVLDSCFSGSVAPSAREATGGLTSPGLAAAPLDPYLRTAAKEDWDFLTGRTVRLFLTSGTNRQEVSDDSAFRESFVSAFDRDSPDNADLHDDDYVTSSELAVYMRRKLARRSQASQEPQLLRLDGENLRAGEYVIRLPGPAPNLSLTLDESLWSVGCGGWGFKQGSLAAEGPCVVLPRDRALYTYHDAEILSRFRVRARSAAGFVVRAQDERNYYLLRITGGGFPEALGRYQLQAFVVRDGVASPLKGSPVPLSEQLKKDVNNGEALQLLIQFVGRRITARVCTKENFLEVGPAKFEDNDQFYPSGTVGWAALGPERFQVASLKLVKRRPPAFEEKKCLPSE